MKKLTMALTMALIFTTSLFGSTSGTVTDNTQDPYSFGMICSDEAVLNAAKEDTLVGKSDPFALTASPKTIKYNKTTDTYTVWALFLAYDDNSEMKDLGYGYMRMFKEFDMKNDRVRSKNVVFYDCKGMTNASTKSDWQNIIPGSMDEALRDFVKSNTRKGK